RDAAEAYVADTTWAGARGMSAPGALLAYLAHRQRLEAEVLPHLPVEWVDLSSPAGTNLPWEPFEEQLTATLAGLIRQGR
ncbi:MAG TPA: hypothetical protein VLQ92_08650, partial [Candidatus Limnocylindrales bacterium]|nr:hypothetical protein [Candidatus Limnocylindrales bacterium]